MKIFELQKRAFQPGSYDKTPVKENDVDNTISEFGYFEEDGVIVGGVFPLETNPDRLIKALEDVEFRKTKRTQGLNTQSRIFGYQPRNSLRQDFCSGTTLNRDNPKAVHELFEMAKEVQQIYKESCPEIYTENAKRSNEVESEWHIPGTIFTSGNLNKNNQINYHKDRGNFETSYNCMITLKKDCVGGNLVLPEYNVKLALPDRSISIFNAQNVMHGVTPMKIGPFGYRYTIVYYSLYRMLHCKTAIEEMKRYQKVKTEMHLKRLKS